MNEGITPPTESPGSREQTVYGRKACWAVFAHRPQDILRVFHAKERRMELAPLLKWAAAVHIPYRELDEEGMRRVSGATHHEGVAMTVRPRTYASYDGAQPAPGTLWMALDRIENPYNLGAILRTCAFFSIETVLVGGAEGGGKVNGAALRAAEGGAESIRLVACPELAESLREMAMQGVCVVGLESDASIALGERPTPRPAVLVAGHEQEGLSAAVRSACSWVCAIPGQGSVTSLNVSVSVGVALAALVGLVPAPARKDRSAWAPRHAAPPGKAESRQPRVLAESAPAAAPPARRKSHPRPHRAPGARSPKPRG